MTNFIRLTQTTGEPTLIPVNSILGIEESPESTTVYMKGEAEYEFEVRERVTEIQTLLAMGGVSS